MKIIMIVVGLAVVLGGGFLLFKKSETTNSPDYQQDNNGGLNAQSNGSGSNIQASPVSGRASSLTELTNKGAVRCDVTISTGDVQMGDYKGVFYSDGKDRFKSEIWSLKSPGTIFHSLVSDPYIYIWTNQENRGIRQNVSKDASGQIVVPDSLEAPYDFSCLSWGVDSAIFQTPSGVNFSEMPQVSNPFGR